MVRISIKSGIKYYALFDGCAKGNPGYSGIGYSVMNEKGTVIFERSLNIGIRTNNQAEFFALVCCLLDCKYNNISRLNVYGDSELVVKGVNGKYKIEDQKLKYYNLLAKYLSKSFEEFLIQHIPRSKN
jgi:ribonuclease HI